MSDQISRPEDLKSHYQARDVARSYVDQRFLLPKNLHLHRRQIELVNGILRRADCRRVLELACGPGRVTRFIDAPAEGVAVDASEEMLELARERVDQSRWRLQLADIFDLDLDRVFDSVYTFRFIRHFDPERRARIYEIIHRHLAPGGTLIFDAPNEVVEKPFREKHPELYPIFDELWTEASLRRELTEAGFGEIVLHPFLKRHGLQRVVSFATKRGLNTFGANVIGWIDGLPGGDAAEWTVQCVRAR